MARKNSQILDVDAPTFARIGSGRQRTVNIPIPTDLMVIDRLPGEGRSAWTVERYLRRGKAYQKCTRLQPFDGHRTFQVRCKMSRSPWLSAARVIVRRVAGVWVWAVAFVRSDGGAA